MSRSAQQRQQQKLQLQQQQQQLLVQQQIAENEAAAAAAEMFDLFCVATTMRQVLGLHRNMCDVVGLRPAPLNEFYPKLKVKVRSWKAQALWKKFDARASHRAYAKGSACTGTRVLVIGAGPCGLRTAIEAQLLGAKVVVIEKRDRISRNNVLHLWPFVITDLRNLGAKKFYGKFCAGSIDHISIRQLQCILLKVALLLGVEVHEGVSFESILEPIGDDCGWRASVTPADHGVSHYEFDVLIGADGKRNTLEGFKRKEFRGKLAIAITANFINKKTEAEAKVEEISGVAFIFNQSFFKEFYSTTGIDLENIVYYKDETHYFVMTAKKHSLIDKGVIMQDFADPAELLAPANVNREKLLDYAREAADFSTNYQMPNLEFAVNHYGKPDVAMFDFTSMFAAETSCRVFVRNGFRLLQCLVGDSLLEPFWPTGSGCARGFLSSMDAAYALKLWSNPRNCTLGVVAQRESIYRLLNQTTPENLQRDIGSYTVDPATRYPNLNRTSVNVWQVKHLIDTDDQTILEQTFMDTNALQATQVETTPVRRKRRSGDSTPLSTVLLRWICAQLHAYEFTKYLKEVSDVFTNGKVLCALINRYRPDLVDFNAIKDLSPIECNELAFKLLDKELQIPRVISGKESLQLNTVESKVWLNYLEQICEVFRGEIPHVKHPKMDFPELREKYRINSSRAQPDFSKLLQLSTKQKLKSPMQDMVDVPQMVVQRRSVLDEDKLKRQRKHEAVGGVTAAPAATGGTGHQGFTPQTDTPRRAKKRRSAEKTTNIEERQKRLQEIEQNRQERLSKRRQQRQQQTQNFYKSLHMLQANNLLREGDDDSCPFEDYSIFLYRQQAPVFNDRVKDLERKLLYPDRERCDIPSAVPRNTDEQFSDRIKSMEQRISSRNTYGTDKKPKDLMRAIGKIDSTDWNVREIEKKIEQSKKTEIHGPKGREKVPKWSKEQFMARQNKMSKPTRQDSGEEKFKEIDQTLKNLDKQLKEGSVLEVGERGRNKVASIAGQFVKKDDTSEERNPPTVVPKSNTKVALAFKKQAASEKCHFCRQTVYLMEKINTEGLILHRSCLKCHHCHTNLRLGGYAFDRDDPNGRFYCTQHFRLPAKVVRPVARKPGQRKPTQQQQAAAAAAATTPVIATDGTANDDKLRGHVDSVAQRDLLDRGQTPERIEFENTDAMSDGEPSEEHIIDEHEWSGRNFLPESNNDSESDLSSSDESDTESDSDLFEEANDSPLGAQTLQLATDWIGKQNYTDTDDSDDFYDSSEGIADDGKDDTEGEEFKKAREMRREEVRLLPLPANLPTDTETESKLDSENKENIETVPISEANTSNSNLSLKPETDKTSEQSFASDKSYKSAESSIGGAIAPTPPPTKADIEKMEQNSERKFSAEIDAISEKLYRMNSIVKMNKDLESLAKENLVKSDILKKLTLKEKWLADNNVGNTAVVAPISRFGEKLDKTLQKEGVQRPTECTEDSRLASKESGESTNVLDATKQTIYDELMPRHPDFGDNSTHLHPSGNADLKKSSKLSSNVSPILAAKQNASANTNASRSNSFKSNASTSPRMVAKSSNTNLSRSNSQKKSPKTNPKNAIEQDNKMQIENILDIVKKMDISPPGEAEDASTIITDKDIGRVLYDVESKFSPKPNKRLADKLKEIETKNFAGTMDTIKSQMVMPTVSAQASASVDLSKYFPNLKEEKSASAATNKNQKNLKDVDLAKYFPTSPVAQKRSVVTVADTLKKSQTEKSVSALASTAPHAKVVAGKGAATKAAPPRQNSLGSAAFSLREHQLDGAVDLTRKKAPVAVVTTTATATTTKKGNVKIVKKIVPKGTKAKKAAAAVVTADETKKSIVSRDEADQIFDEILQSGDQEVRSPSWEYQNLFNEEKSPSDDISDKIERILEETGYEMAKEPNNNKRKLLKAKSLGEGEFKQSANKLTATNDETTVKEDDDLPTGVQNILKRFESMSSVKSDEQTFKLRRMESTTSNLNKSRESIVSRESDSLSDLEKTMEYLKSEWRSEATNFLKKKRDNFYAEKRSAAAEETATKAAQQKKSRQEELPVQYRQSKLAKFFGIKPKSPEKRKSPITNKSPEKKTISRKSNSPANNKRTKTPSPSAEKKSQSSLEELAKINGAKPAEKKNVTSSNPTPNEVSSKNTVLKPEPPRTERLPGKILMQPTNKDNLIVPGNDAPDGANKVINAKAETESKENPNSTLSRQNSSDNTAPKHSPDSDLFRQNSNKESPISALPRLNSYKVAPKPEPKEIPISALSRRNSSDNTAPEQNSDSAVSRQNSATATATTEPKENPTSAYSRLNSYNIALKSRRNSSENTAPEQNLDSALSKQNPKNGTAKAELKESPLSDLSRQNTDSVAAKTEPKESSISALSRLNSDNAATKQNQDSALSRQNSYNFAAKTEVKENPTSAYSRLNSYNVALKSELKESQNSTLSRQTDNAAPKQIIDTALSKQHSNNGITKIEPTENSISDLSRRNADNAAAKTEPKATPISDLSRQTAFNVATKVQDIPISAVSRQNLNNAAPIQTPDSALSQPNINNDGKNTTQKESPISSVTPANVTNSTTDTPLKQSLTADIVPKESSISDLSRGHLTNPTVESTPKESTFPCVSGPNSDSSETRKQAEEVTTPVEKRRPLVEDIKNLPKTGCDKSLSNSRRGSQSSLLSRRLSNSSLTEKLESAVVEFAAISTNYASPCNVEEAFKSIVDDLDRKSAETKMSSEPAEDDYDSLRTSISKSPSVALNTVQLRGSSEDESIENLFSQFSDDMLVNVEFDSNDELVGITPRVSLLQNGDSVKEMESPDREPFEKLPSDRDSFERLPIDQQTLQNQLSDRQHLEKQSFDRQPLEKLSYDRDPIDRKLIAGNPSDRKPNEKLSSGQEPFEKLTSGQEPFEKLSYDRGPIDKKPVPDNPSDRKPIEKLSSDREPFKKLSSGQEPFERPSSGQEPFEKLSYDREPVNKKPVPDNLSDRKPIEKPSSYREPFEKLTSGQESLQKVSYDREPIDKKPVPDNSYREPFENLPSDRKPFQKLSSNREPFEKQSSYREHFENVPSDKKPIEKLSPDKGPMKVLESSKTHTTVLKEEMIPPPLVPNVSSLNEEHNKELMEDVHERYAEVQFPLRPQRRQKSTSSSSEASAPVAPQRMKSKLAKLCPTTMPPSVQDTLYEVYAKPTDELPNGKTPPLKFPHSFDEDEVVAAAADQGVKNSDSRNSYAGEREYSYGKPEEIAAASPELLRKLSQSSNKVKSSAESSPTAERHATNGSRPESTVNVSPASKRQHSMTSLRSSDTGSSVDSRRGSCNLKNKVEDAKTFDNTIIVVDSRDVGKSLIASTDRSSEGNKNVLPKIITPPKVPSKEHSLEWDMEKLPMSPMPRRKSGQAQKSILQEMRREVSPTASMKLLNDFLSESNPTTCQNRIIEECEMKRRQDLIKRDRAYEEMQVSARNSDQDSNVSKKSTPLASPPAERSYPSARNSDQDTHSNASKKITPLVTPQNQSPRDSRTATEEISNLDTDRSGTPPMYKKLVIPSDPKPPTPSSSRRSSFALIELMANNGPKVAPMPKKLELPKIVPKYVPDPNELPKDEIFNNRPAWPNPMQDLEPNFDSLESDEEPSVLRSSTKSKSRSPTPEIFKNRQWPDGKTDFRKQKQPVYLDPDNLTQDSRRPTANAGTKSNVSTASMMDSRKTSPYSSMHNSTHSLLAGPRSSHSSVDTEANSHMGSLMSEHIPQRPVRISKATAPVDAGTRMLLDRSKRLHNRKLDFMNERVAERNPYMRNVISEEQLEREALEAAEEEMESYRPQNYTTPTARFPVSRSAGLSTAAKQYDYSHPTSLYGDYALSSSSRPTTGLNYHLPSPTTSSYGSSIGRGSLFTDYFRRSSPPHRRDRELSKESCVQSESESTSPDEVELNSATEISTDSEFDHDEIIRETPKIFIDDTHLRKQPTKVQIKSSVITSAIGHKHPPTSVIAQMKTGSYLHKYQPHPPPPPQFKPLVQVDPALLSTNRTPLQNPRPGDYLLNKTASTEGIASKKSLELKKRYLLGEPANGNKIQKSGSTSVLDSRIRSFQSNISECQKLLNPSSDISPSMKTFLDRTKLGENAHGDLMRSATSNIINDIKVEITIQKASSTASTDNEKENIFVNSKNELNKGMEYSETVNTTLLNSLSRKSPPTPTNNAIIIETIDLVTPEKQAPIIDLTKVEVPTKLVAANVTLINKVEHAAISSNGSDHLLSADSNKIIDLTSDSPVKSDTTIIEDNKPDVSRDVRESIPDILGHIGNDLVHIEKQSKVTSPSGEENLRLLSNSGDEEKRDSPEKLEEHYENDSVQIQVPNIAWNTRKPETMSSTTESTCSSNTSSIEDIQHYILESTTSPDTHTTSGHRVPRVEIHDTSGTLMQIDSCMIIDGKYVGDPEDLRYMQGVIVPPMPGVKTSEVEDDAEFDVEPVTATPEPVERTVIEADVQPPPLPEQGPPLPEKAPPKMKPSNFKFDSRNENKIESLKNLPLIVEQTVEHTKAVKPLTLNLSCLQKSPNTPTTPTPKGQTPTSPLFDSDKTPTADLVSRGSDSETEPTGTGTGTGQVLTETELSDWTADDCISENFVDMEFVLNSNKGTIKRNKKGRKKLNSVKLPSTRELIGEIVKTAPVAEFEGILKTINIDDIEFMDTGSEGSCAEAYSATNTALLRNRGYMEFIETTPKQTPKQTPSHKIPASVGAAQNANLPSEASNVVTAKRDEKLGIDYIEQGAYILQNEDSDHDLLKTPVNEGPTIAPAAAAKTQTQTPSTAMTQSLTDSSTLNDLDEDSLCVVTPNSHTQPSSSTATKILTEESDALTVVTSPLDSSSPKTQDYLGADLVAGKHSEAAGVSSPSSSDKNPKTSLSTCTATSSSTTSSKATPPRSPQDHSPTSASLPGFGSSTANGPRKASDELSYEEYVRALQQKITQISTAREQRRKSSKGEAPGAAISNNTQTVIEQAPSKLQLSSDVAFRPPADMTQTHKVPEIPTLTRKLEEITKERTKQKDLIHDLVMDKLQSKKQLNAEKRLHRSRQRTMLTSGYTSGSSLSPTPKLAAAATTTDTNCTNQAHYHVSTAAKTGDGRRSSQRLQSTTAIAANFKENNPLQKSPTYIAAYVSPTRINAYKQRPFSEHIDAEQLDAFERYKLSKTPSFSYALSSAAKVNLNGQTPLKEDKPTAPQYSFATPIAPLRQNRGRIAVAAAPLATKEAISLSTENLRIEARARARLRTNSELGLSPEEKMELLRKRLHVEHSSVKAKSAADTTPVKSPGYTKCSKQQMSARDRKMSASKSVNDLLYFANQAELNAADENFNTKSNAITADFTSDPNLLLSSSCAQTDVKPLKTKSSRRPKDPERRKSLIQSLSSFFHKGSSSSVAQNTKDKKDQHGAAAPSAAGSAQTERPGTSGSNTTTASGSVDGVFSRFRISPKSKEKSKDKDGYKLDATSVIVKTPATTSTTSITASSAHGRSNSQDCLPRLHKATTNSNYSHNYNYNHNYKHSKKSATPTPTAAFSSSSPQLFVNKSGYATTADEQTPPPIPPLPLNYQRSDDESYATETREQKKQQRAISKAVRQAELKRLRIAQEIQREQEEIEVQLKELEARGVLIEKALRGEGQNVDNLDSTNTFGSNDEKLLKELLEIWRNITQLKKRDEELGIRQQELQLEHRHAQLKEELNLRLSSNKLDKSSADVAAEGAILNEMLDIVAKRAALRPTTSNTDLTTAATTDMGATTSTAASGLGAADGITLLKVREQSQSLDNDESNI